MAASITAILLLLLPLDVWVTFVTCFLLVLVLVMLKRQRLTDAGIGKLTIDVAEQCVGIARTGDELVNQPINCQVKYFSPRLVMLSYRRSTVGYFGCRRLRRYSSMPIFRGMLSDEDFSRLLAVARLKG